jgi:hypothetical protein
MLERLAVRNMIRSGAFAVLLGLFAANVEAQVAALAGK